MAQFMQDEAVLRYNGMFISVWALLAQARATTQAVATATEAQRDFWLADVDLQLALNAPWQAQPVAGAGAPAKGEGGVSGPMGVTPASAAPASAAPGPTHSAHSAAPAAEQAATEQVPSPVQTGGSTQPLPHKNGRQTSHTPTHQQQGH